MRTIKINRYRVTKRALAAATAVLRAGGVVAFPTETAYGLAADPANPVALQKIYAIKGRTASKQLPFIAADLGQVKLFLSLPKLLQPLAEKYWPGPLSIVLITRKGRALRGWPTVAVRVPGLAWARALPQAFGRPVTSTSANLSGESAAYSGAAVKRQFADARHQPDLLLDAGSLPKRPPSTIVKLGRGGLIVLRAGAVKVE
jgi:L-threonylcarbamoyladenylate synthase